MALPSRFGSFWTSSSTRIATFSASRWRPGPMTWPLPLTSWPLALRLLAFPGTKIWLVAECFRIKGLKRQIKQEMLTHFSILPSRDAHTESWTCRDRRRWTRTDCQNSRCVCIVLFREGLGVQLMVTLIDQPSFSSLLPSIS